MAVTYEKIATNTLATSAASITFSTISGAYTDLVIVTNVKSTTTGNVIMRFNSDSSALYSRTMITADGASLASNRLTGYSEIYTDSNGYFDGSNFNQSKIIQIMNYSNSTTFKSCIIRSNRPATGVDAKVAVWRSTAAITSILLSGNGQNFVAGSTFNLYGILKAA
jgi:hypothetical protein